MSFDDIDTPLSDEELSGENTEQTEAEAPEQEAPAEEVTEAAPAESPAEAPTTEAPAEEKPERDPVIPRARFDEVNSKLQTERAERERIQAELDALKAPKATEEPAAPPADIDALEEQYLSATFEANAAKALEIRRQINAELQRQAEGVAERRIVAREQAAAQQREQALLDAEAKRMVAEHPELNEDGNPLIGEVIEWRDFYMSKGVPAHEALKKAEDRVFPNQPAPAPDTRANAAIQRNAAAANAQPPRQDAGIGNRAAPSMPPINTQEDWEKLSDREREQLLKA